MSDYDTDILTWSERQADLLRRVGAGETINDQMAWSDIIEEIEAVGQSQVDAVESWLFQIFVHLLKALAWARSSVMPHWQAEICTFRAQARRRYRPSMVQKIDLAAIYADALYAMPETIDALLPLPVPVECGFTLDEILTLEDPNRLPKQPQSSADQF